MNLKQLSDSLGLSQTTVSRALNGYSDVSEATRQRVMEMAQKMGYKPNTMARRLATGKADAIGLVYPLDSIYLGDPRFVEVVEGLTDKCSEFHLDVLIASSSKGHGLDTYQRLIRGHRVDGLIVARTYLDDPRIQFLSEAKVPFVAYGRTADPSQFAWFDFDNAMGTRLAVEQLVALGHKRIAYIHSSLALTFAAQRHEGFCQAMQAAGLPVAAEFVREGGNVRRQSYESMQAILQSAQRPTAVIVDNNQAGVGVVRALLEAGLVLGKDCSVIVYDGVPEDTLQVEHQVITAIEQPTAYDVGQKLAELIVGVMQGKPVAELQVLWQPVLHAGTSDGPCLQA